MEVLFCLLGLRNIRLRGLRYEKGVFSFCRAGLQWKRLVCFSEMGCERDVFHFFELVCKRGVFLAGLWTRGFRAGIYEQWKRRFFSWATEETFFGGVWKRRFFEVACGSGVFSKWGVKGAFSLFQAGLWTRRFSSWTMKKKKNHVFKDITTIIIIVI